METDLHLQVS